MLMFPAQSTKKITFPSDWQCISRSNVVQSKLIEIFNRFGPTMYGDYLLRLGPLSHALDWQAHGLRRELHIGSEPYSQNSYCISDYHALAVQEHAIDAILALHALDFTHDPHLQLREFDRVLRADGYLILSGFNPVSLSGLARYSPWYAKHPLKQARYFSYPRVKDWLSLLNFEVVHCEFIAGHNVFSNSQKDKISEGWQRLAYTRSFYVVIARKRETPLNLVSQKFVKIKPRLRPATVHLNTAKKVR